MATPDLAALEAMIAALEDQVKAMPTQMANYDEPLDNIWMLLCGYLVWFMSAGFCFLEMGSLRGKHSDNILAKNLLVPILAFFCWYIMGYALAFGSQLDSPNQFIGGTFFVMHGFWTQKSQFRQWFFQGAFCDTSASIVSGGIAERMTMFGYCTHTIFMTSFIYPLVVYWAWSGSGWLNYIDPEDSVQKSTFGPWYQDWAGSGVIHLVGGVAALCGAVVVGPRVGRFAVGAHNEDFAPVSVPFTVLGTFLLWLGWFGFNPGCTLGMHTDDLAYRAAIAACNTAVAPAAAGLVAWLIRRYALPPYVYDVPAFCNAILAGCVAVTAGSGFVKMWEAIVIGAIGGFLYCMSVQILNKIKIDDPIEAISVHFVNGLWGAIAIGFFGDPKHGIQGNGVFYGGNQLGVQVVACICFIVWSGGLSLAIFVPIHLVGWLRWPEDVQVVGANVMQHSPPKAYAQQPISDA